MYKVVIADDNRATADRLAVTIDWRALNCTVAGVAYDGVAGRGLILAKKPDIVIADIRMPGLDGLRMVEVTRSASPHSRIIFISAYDDFAYAQKAVGLHASDYLLKPFENGAVVAAVKRALAELGAAAAGQPQGAGGGSLMADSIVAYIRTHLSTQLSLEELSGHFGLSPAYVSSLIRKKTGQTYTDWLTEARMDLAKRLLRDPGHRIDEIASAVGYKNYVNFYRVFVKYEGISPTDYRNRTGGKGDVP